MTLLRRATFDLTGLPPTPAEIDAFLADTNPDAFPRLVDRLLASPHYGERWGRHWLDVVRYADSAGETADFPVPDAWRYRNYVIDAFNHDMPYDQFLREQIAGDLLAAKLPPDASPDRHAELIVATGYLAAARRFGFDISKDHHLTIEDTIDVLGKSVLGLTVGCARCHDHKYDPVSAADYYALYGIFDSSRFPFPGCEKYNRPKDLVPLTAPAERAKQQQLAKESSQRLEAQQKEADAALRAALLPAPLVNIEGAYANGGAQDFAAGSSAAALQALAVKPGDLLQIAVLPRANFGADATLVEFEIAEVGGAKRVWNLTSHALADQSADRFNGPTWYAFDLASVPQPLTTPVRDVYSVRGLHSWRGSAEWPSVFINTNSSPVAFQTVKQPAHALMVHPGPKGGVALAWESPFAGTVTVRGRVGDLDPSGGDGIAWNLTHHAAVGPALRLVAAVGRERGKLNAPTVDPQGYAMAEGAPHHVKLQLRGDPETLGEVVPRRYLELFGGNPVAAPDKQSGRLQLADWLTGPQTPLTPRVLVNRLWQHHFGVGLVKTPNDFGNRGDTPTHPELLDYLAQRFVADGWSIKRLHRFLMTSDAYQRAGTFNADDARLDPDNLSLWRFPRRRLSAEEIRDAVLLASGDLDRTPAGPHPFPASNTWGFSQHGPFIAVYEHDRRSVYLMVQRIKRHPFLALFDGADANASTGSRYATTVPPQALFFLNDPMVHTKATALAQRLMPLPDDNARLDDAYRRLFGRMPQPRERTIASRFLDDAAKEAAGSPDERRRTAWAGWVRTLMASNEFIYLD